MTGHDEDFAVVVGVITASPFPFHADIAAVAASCGDFRNQGRCPRNDSCCDCCFLNLQPNLLKGGILHRSRKHHRSLCVDGVVGRQGVVAVAAAVVGRFVVVFHFVVGVEGVPEGAEGPLAWLMCHRCLKP